MKKKILLLPVLALLLAGCKPTNVVPDPIIEPTGISIVANEASFNGTFVGLDASAQLLTAVVNPSSTVFEVEWSVTDPSVINANFDGITAQISPKGFGTSQLVAKVTDSNDIPFVTNYTVAVTRLPALPVLERISQLYDPSLMRIGMATSELRGRVVASNANGLVVGDRSDYVLLYKGPNWAGYTDYPEGSTVRFVGKIGVYAGCVQVTEATINLVTDVRDEIPENILPFGVEISANDVTNYLADGKAKLAASGLGDFNLVQGGIVRPIRGYFSGVENFASGTYINQRMAGTEVALAFQPSKNNLLPGTFNIFDGFLLGIGSTSGVGRVNLYANETSLNTIIPGDPVESIEIAEAGVLSIDLGKSLNINVTVSPSTAFQLYRGATSDANVANFAIVGSDARISAAAEANIGDTATITLTTYAVDAAGNPATVDIPVVIVDPDLPPVPVGNSIFIDFSTLTGSGSGINDSIDAVFKGAAGENADKIASVTKEGGNVYDGDADNAGLIKIGSGSSDATRTATFTITLAAGLSANALQVVGWSWAGNSENEFAIVKVNGGAGQTLTARYSVKPSGHTNPTPMDAAPTTLDFTIEVASNVITITTAGSTARSLIQSIKIGGIVGTAVADPGDDPGDDPSDEPVPFISALAKNLTSSVGYADTWGPESAQGARWLGMGFNGSGDMQRFGTNSGQASKYLGTLSNLYGNPNYADLPTANGATFAGIDLPQTPNKIEVSFGGATGSSNIEGVAIEVSKTNASIVANYKVALDADPASQVYFGFTPIADVTNQTLTVTAPTADAWNGAVSVRIYLVFKDGVSGNTFIDLNTISLYGATA